MGHHIGSMVNPQIETKTMTIDVEGGEFINFFQVFSENLADRIEIKTNKGQKFEVGSEIKENHKVEKPLMTETSRLIAIRAGLGGHIHNIQCIFV